MNYDVRAVLGEPLLDDRMSRRELTKRLLKMEEIIQVLADRLSAMDGLQLTTHARPAGYGVTTIDANVPLYKQPAGL